MEFTVLNDSEILSIEVTDTGILFTTKIMDIDANIAVDGIEEIFKNGNKIEIDGFLEVKLQSLCSVSNIKHVVNRNKIKSVDLNITSIEDNTFSEANVITTDGDVFRFVGEMKGTVLNLEDFEDYINDNINIIADEDDVDWDDYDCSCGCNDCTNEDCDCDCD
jgi:hypothetical protein